MDTCNVEVELDDTSAPPAAVIGASRGDREGDDFNPPRPDDSGQLGDLRKTANVDAVATASDAYQLAEHRARYISALSIVASVVVAFVGIAVSLEGGALAVLGLAGETLLDGVSSVMVIWRFKKGKPRECADAEEEARRVEARNIERERKFTLVIGISFVMFAVFLLLLSCVHLTHQWAESELEEWAASKSWYVAWPAFVMFSVFSHVKFQLSTELNSKTLRQDAICSIFGAFLAFLTGLASSLENTLVEDGDDARAFGMVDPMASSVIAILILGEGCRTVYHNALWCQTHQQFA